MEITGNTVQHVECTGLERVVFVNLCVYFCICKDISEEKLILRAHDKDVGGDRYLAELIGFSDANYSPIATSTSSAMIAVVCRYYKNETACCCMISIYLL